jgi:hypothetical protein
MQDGSSHSPSEWPTRIINHRLISVSELVNSCYTMCICDREQWSPPPCQSSGLQGVVSGISGEYRP